MLSRFTATGVTADDKEVLLAYELREEEFKVNLYIIPKKSLKGDALQLLEKNWVEGEAFEFPKGTKEVAPKLQGEESILPSDIRSEESGKIRTKQNEWAYTLLTAKLWESYLLELEELKKKATELTQYDRQLFDDAKSFWERVLEHRKERDISQESLDKIKDDVNSVFEKLKTFRKTENAEFEATSAKLRDEVIAKLEALRGRVNEKANFKALQEEHKTIQNESRKNRYSKSDDALVRKNLDSLFQYINEQRNLFFNDLNANRIKGLNEVIDKMESSLNRDKKDLEYMNQKLTSNKISSLEMQLIKVKQNMLNETMSSKEEKLKDIRSTLEHLLKQTGKGKKKEVKEETNKEETVAQSAEPGDAPNPSAGE
ncbi:MAG: hypothetical protein NTY88_11940 [Bacteroidetes bacterium]|nr:hypothetical protein [Bacteroidota bacterium]